ncbi:MAG: type II toxin-antitoxin system RelE/ParE family toxin [Coriobacteriia bacterium]
MKVVWSKRARIRAAEIATYIAQDSPPTSARVVDELFAAVERLAVFPVMGKPARGVMTSGVRELVVGRFRVFYEVGADIDILTVRHGRELVDEREFEGRG